MKLSFILVITCFLPASCLLTEKRYPIWLTNNSNSEIYVQVSDKYPDSSVLETDKFLLKVKPSQNQLLDEFDEPIDEVFTDRFPKDTMLLFIFEPDTIKSYSWNEIMAGNKFIKLNFYSKMDLKALDWTIEYP